MAAVSTGTSCTYGIAGTVTNLFVQSYTISASFNNEGMVQDEAGLTKTARYDDRKTELTVDGVVKTLNVEGPGKFEVSDAQTMLAQAKAARA